MAVDKERNLENIKEQKNLERQEQNESRANLVDFLWDFVSKNIIRKTKRIFY